jgi:taurine dioxygenase
MRQRRLKVIEAVLQSHRQPYRTFAVRPLSPMVGAEIEGLDLRQELTDAEGDELCRAFLEHHVLVFRDHPLAEADHGRIARQFGFVAERGLRHATTQGGDSAAVPVMLAHCWRADETYRTDPPAGGILHMHGPPRLGADGDMLFADMQLAYALLSDPLKALLTGLTAVHAPRADAPELAEANNTAEHPVVTRHPVTGAPTLFVNPTHTSHIVQLDPEHSDATLQMLFRHLVTQPVVTCRIRWTPDTVVVWDNRAVQHLTLQDFLPEDLSGHFVNLAGDRPQAWGV